MTAISTDELARRAAILRRFRELLLTQRDRFQNYLTALDKQQSIIKAGNAEELLAHVELEEQIVADIFSIQKVIDPLEAMYHSVKPGLSSDDDVPTLKTTLENLKNEAAARFAHNKELLCARMAQIRAEITSLRNNPFAAMARPLYENTVSASLVDLSG